MAAKEKKEPLVNVTFRVTEETKQWLISQKESYSKTIGRAISKFRGTEFDGKKMRDGRSNN